MILRNFYGPMIFVILNFHKNTKSYDIKPECKGIIKKITSNNNFLSLMNKALNSGAKILGGCCGTSPRHITLIKNKFLNS